MYLIDTNIAIHLRDEEPEILSRIEQLPILPAISILTWVELEGGVHREAEGASQRRAALDAFLTDLLIVRFDAAVVRAYGAILATCGYSRSRTIDRLIAATAIVNDLTLVTINAADFREIPGLKLEIWPSPTAQ